MQARAGSYVHRFHKLNIRSPCRTVFDVALHSQAANTVVRVLRLTIKALQNSLLVKLCC